MKTFYICKVTDGVMATTEAELFSGTITDARKALAEDRYPAGEYRILEDTSGIITKSVESAPKVKIAFESSRKRGPRQPKSEGEQKPKNGKKK